MLERESSFAKCLPVVGAANARKAPLSICNTLGMCKLSTWAKGLDDLAVEGAPPGWHLVTHLAPGAPTRPCNLELKSRRKEHAKAQVRPDLSTGVSVPFTPCTPFKFQPCRALILHSSLWGHPQAYASPRQLIAHLLPGGGCVHATAGPPRPGPEAHVHNLGLESSQVWRYGGARVYKGGGQGGRQDAQAPAVYGCAAQLEGQSRARLGSWAAAGQCSASAPQPFTLLNLKTKLWQRAGQPPVYHPLPSPNRRTACRIRQPFESLSQPQVWREKKPPCKAAATAGRAWDDRGALCGPGGPRCSA